VIIITRVSYCLLLLMPQESEEFEKEIIVQPVKGGIFMKL